MPENSPLVSARALAMRQRIVEAADLLFRQHGYEQVTMRHIAKQAACSHTSIYVHFADKEALLHEVASPYLETLSRDFAALAEAIPAPGERVLALSERFIAFCLAHHSLQRTLFITRSARVDLPQTSAINQLRVSLFAHLQQALTACLALPPGNPAGLMAARSMFYLLQGIVSTYSDADESSEQLLARLSATFRQAICAMRDGLILSAGAASRAAAKEDAPCDSSN